MLDGFLRLRMVNDNIGRQSHCRPTNSNFESFFKHDRRIDKPILLHINNFSSTCIKAIASWEDFTFSKLHPYITDILCIVRKGSSNARASIRSAMASSSCNDKCFKVDWAFKRATPPPVPRHREGHSLAAAIARDATTFARFSLRIRISPTRRIAVPPSKRRDVFGISLSHALPWHRSFSAYLEQRNVSSNEARSPLPAYIPNKLSVAHALRHIPNRAPENPRVCHLPRVKRLSSSQYGYVFDVSDLIHLECTGEFAQTMLSIVFARLLLTSSPVTLSDSSLAIITNFFTPT